MNMNGLCMTVCFVIGLDLVFGGKAPIQGTALIVAYLLEMFWPAKWSTSSIKQVSVDTVYVQDSGAIWRKDDATDGLLITLDTIPQLHTDDEVLTKDGVRGIVVDTTSSGHRVLCFDKLPESRICRGTELFTD